MDRDILQVNKKNEDALGKMTTIYTLIETGRITSMDDLKQYMKKAIEDVRERHYKEVAP